ncbi:MAG: DMT family protein [Bacteroidia bacterium]|nr:DMT family protein [Bacteroidia bacterium]
MQYLLPIFLLLLSNTFMTFAWYGHLKIHQWLNIKNPSMLTAIFISWGIAFFEYCLMVPANKLGYVAKGGAYDLWQLKIIQEAISVTVFTIFAIVFFKEDPLRWNYLWGFIFLLFAVYFFFKK